ncbi:MAG: hypothetical protein O2834_04860 [Crenarchaeota archaeon]|nr:hypothetical protein [Thermoproteota archaeon]HJJ20715.1 hypothetical protein [Nitrosopumilus sp.]MDA0853515.1 hypothetical protein [Thermoproteota archaeon]MDA1123542.1 hypothetical protein [Thermoproteota archaeon]HJJ24257.1 hypothetical protein [Nitrosopumilus sp.]
MDLKKFIENEELSNFPIGLGGCRSLSYFFDSCDYDLIIFDENSSNDQIISFENNLITIHHASLSETNTKKLLQYDKLKIIQDESWNLKIFLSTISEKRDLLFYDFAKNSLIESIFCCQKTLNAIQSGDIFAPCWQKCASYYLADAISSLNKNHSSPSHMLDSLRKFEKNSINNHISNVLQTIGIERATPTLLERMLKSSIGFSDIIEKNNHSELIQKKYDYFLNNSMLSDCYFYLGYINKENFIQIKDELNQRGDLIHILKIAFDIESDSNLLTQQAKIIQSSCNDILEMILST